MRLNELISCIEDMEDILIDFEEDEVILSGPNNGFHRKIKDLNKYAVMNISICDNAIAIKVRELTDLELSVGEKNEN